MGKVYRGIYIDYNKSVEICVHENGDKLEPEFILDPKREDDKGYRHYINNIKRMLKCQYNVNEKGEKQGIDVMLGKLRVTTISNYQKFGEIDRETGEYEQLEFLTATEERILSQGDIAEIEKFDVPFDRKKTKTPKTDLHTHLSGALTVEDMLSIGETYNCLIPVDLLKRAGIDTSKYQGKLDIVEFIDKKTNEPVRIERVHFKDLTPEDVEKYSQRLSIKQNAQETFLAMEECYDFRDPFVKLKPDFLDKDVKIKDVFLDQLRCLAKHYQETGVEYAELSTADICKNPADFAKMLDEVMPIIESEYPDVKLRFLGGIPRVLPKNSLRMRNQNLLASAKSPYIVGLDVMAHEVNETDHFKEIIQDCVEYANQHDPNFVIRVHAGESAVHYDNVKQFLKTVKESLVAGMKPPVIRIGHGIHGLDAETLDLCKELGAIIEINMSSNIALNNADRLSEIDVKKYIDAGVQVCFGTDGHGMYSTDARQEAICATSTGVTPEDMERVVAGEEAYIDRMTESSEKKMGESVEEKMTYLVSIADTIRKVGLSLRGQTLSKEAFAEELCKRLEGGTLGKIVEISSEDMIHLLDSGILRLSAETAKGLTPEQKKHLTSHMPQSYYREQYTMDSKEKDLLDVECERESEAIKQQKADRLIEFETSAKPEDNVKIIGTGGAIPAVDGKKPIFLMGYVSKEWTKLKPEEKENVIRSATEFIASIDPKKAYVVTTCDTSGFNVIIHDIIKKVNPDLLVNGIVDEQQLETMTPKQRDWIYKKFDNVKVEKGHLFSYSSKLVQFLNEQDGQMVAFGEGSHLKDHITNMHNNSEGRIHLFNDQSGISTKVKFLQGNGYEFSNFGDLSTQMGDLLSANPTITAEEIQRLIADLIEKHAKAAQQNAAQASRQIDTQGMGD